MAKQIGQGQYLVTGLLLLSIFASGWTHAGLYKWVDENGKTHYGDKPPAQSGSAHSILNSRGLTIDEVNRAQTAEERAEETRIAEENKARFLEQQKNRHRDNVLLQTFTTERDLLLTRDDRLSALQGAILLSQRRIDGWSSKLADVEGQIGAFESAEQIPIRLKNERDHLQRRIANSEEYKQKKQEEHESTAAQFLRDLTRYRELKSGG